MNKKRRLLKSAFLLVKKNYEGTGEFTNLSLSVIEKIIEYENYQDTLTPLEIIESVGEINKEGNRYKEKLNVYDDDNLKEALSTSIILLISDIEAEYRLLVVSNITVKPQYDIQKEKVNERIILFPLTLLRV
jgi:hypothetical protein